VATSQEGIHPLFFLPEIKGKALILFKSPMDDPGGGTANISTNLDEGLFERRNIKLIKVQ
jgi:hypothetical protein